jgi:hypothetical protein
VSKHDQYETGGAFMRYEKKCQKSKYKLHTEGKFVRKRNGKYHTKEVTF